MTVTGDGGSVTLPLAVTDLPDGVVWVPVTKAWSGRSGSVVRVDGGAA